MESPVTNELGVFTDLINLLKETAFKCNCSFLLEGAVELEAIVTNSRRPFEVAFFGRMKTGKSSLINAYIGQHLAITGVEEATATINKLTYGSPEQNKTFTVHWKNRIPAAQTFPLESLQADWNGKSPEVLKRIAQTAYLELKASVDVLRKVQIIDTPGTGSVAEAHEDVARQFISGRQTDALVYVFAPVGRGADAEDLSLFRKQCVEDSTPYNSVAVLHKWDHIYWGNGGNWSEIASKANRILVGMEKLVAEVVPVSAPLAMVVRCAPDEFWQRVMDIYADFDDELDLTDELEEDTVWNSVPQRAALYREAKSYGMPWSGFQIMVRHLYRERPSSLQEAKRSIESLSGIQGLEELLERRFFKRSALLQQRKMRADARAVLKTIDERLSALFNKTEEELHYLRQLNSIVEHAAAKQHELTSWLNNKIYALHAQSEELKRRHIEIDRIRLRVKEELINNEISLDILPWLDARPNLLPKEEQALLISLLSGDGAENAPKNNETVKNFNSLQNLIAGMMNHPDISIKRNAEKIYDFLIAVSVSIFPN